MQDWNGSSSEKRVSYYCIFPPMYCIGDGNPGIWKLFQEIGEAEQRKEILHWSHLKKNLYKVGG